MGMLDSIQLPNYCEESLGHLTEQPANAVTTLAVMLVAVRGYAIWRRRGGLDRGTLFMVAFTFLIGLGALLFHMIPTPFTLVADVLPIMLFMLCAFMLILTRLLEQTPLQTVLHLAGFLTSSLMVTLMLTPQALGNGAWLVTPLIVLYILGGTLVLRARLAMHDNQHLVGHSADRSDRKIFPQLKMGYALIQCGLVLAVGLLVRAYDMRLCGDLPFGLHFVWHIIVSIAVMILLNACILYTEPEPFGHKADDRPLEPKV